MEATDSDQRFGSIAGVKQPGVGVVLTIIGLDASGIGLTLPILPRLLSEVAHTTELGWRYGAFLSLYALMQFVFSPVLGMWSDRIGRRPVLLGSLAGATIDYLFMALAPSLSLLFIGRAIAGLTGASQAVASAYISDVTMESQRARRFGQLSAFQGLGLIAGPVVGGLLGNVWLRGPFVAAAALNGITFLVTLFLLREPTRHQVLEAPMASLNPIKPFQWALSIPSLLPLLLIYMVFTLIGQVGATIWVIYGADQFAWTPFWIGVSIACFGLGHAIAQAFLAGPAAERFGERATLLAGVVSDSVATVVLGFATRGWIAFTLMPLFCLGGLGFPALQSLLTRQADAQSQGRLQGVLASLLSLTSIVGPLAISALYFATRHRFPGLVWVAAASLYLITLPSLLSLSAKATPQVAS
jgi:DHA1 family tetracycline resistance protein-like MFS transporter